MRKSGAHTIVLAWQLQPTANGQPAQMTSYPGTLPVLPLTSPGITAKESAAGFCDDKRLVVA